MEMVHFTILFLVFIVFRTMIYAETTTAQNNTNLTSGGGDEEDPDLFSFSRMKMTRTSSPEAKLYEEDPIAFFDKKIQHGYRYLIHKESCNHTEFMIMMPQFWTEYFAGTYNVSQLQDFGNLYWNISIEFQPGETNATVEGHCLHDERVDNCTVERPAQLKREKDLCFSGGLLECSLDETCVCLQSFGTLTVRVDPKTAQPDPEGTACFVAEGYPCYIRHYKTKDLELPCVNHIYCDSYSGNCVSDLSPTEPIYQQSESEPLE